MPDATETVDEDEDVEESLRLDQRLAAPLDLLRSVSERLRKRDIQVSKSRLDGLFSHIQGAVGEVLEFAQEQFQTSLDQLSDATEELAEALDDDPEAVEQAADLIEDFEAGRAHIQEALSNLKQTFFSASSFEELEQRQDDFAIAEAQMEEGFSRLEMAILKTEEPDLFNISEEASSVEVGTALEALAESVEALNQHLEDGSPEAIESALAYIEQAQWVLERALHGPPEEEDESE